MLQKMKSKLLNTKHLGQNVFYHFMRIVICVNGPAAKHSLEL